MNTNTHRASFFAQAFRASRWVYLLALCAAPVIVVSLTQDIGAHAYDAAVEHIYRGVAFSQVISDGVWYPRWTQSLHWGLGSPLFTFQPPLPYYGMDLLYRLGVPHPIGWRWLVAVGFALAFTGAYLLVWEITKRRWPALLAGVAYLYAPYVLRNALERGSNEAYSMFLYPLVLWSLIFLAARPTFFRFLLATLFSAACIGSHVLGPLMLAPFAALLALFLYWRYRTTAPMAALLVGGLLMAFVWLPMASEQGWVHVERDFSQPEAIPAENPIALERLLAPPTVFDVTRDDNRTGDRVGLIHTVLLIAGAPAVFWAWRRNRKIAYALIASTLLGFFLFFLLTGWSDWLWRLGGSLTARLLYRTRLMGLQALAAATVIGLLVAALPQRWQRFVAPVVASALVLTALPSLYVQYQHAYASFEPPVDLQDVRTMEIRHGGTALTAFGEFTPRWRTAPFDEKLLGELGEEFNAQAQPLVNAPGEITIRSAQVRNQAWDLQLQTAEAVTATLHLLYYARWQAYLDGQPAAASAQPDTGYLQVSIPAGAHQLSLRYGSTGAERIGIVVSGVTLLLLTCVGMFQVYRGKRYPCAFIAQGSDTGEMATCGPPSWVLVALTGLLAFKIAFVDPHTSWLRCVSTEDRVCGATATVEVPFAAAPSLRGYWVESYTVRTGDELRVRLYWQAQSVSEHPMASFVHIRNSAEAQPPSPYSPYGIWAQEEHRAWGGILSTEFTPGKLYEDEYQLNLPKDMPPGEYFLEIGWFDPATGEQAAVPSEAVQAPLHILWRSVLLPNLHVKPKQ